jgi:SWI/SNF-related matrix-associated actin-dependent regulator of chromatin subfamily A-like protein 1
MKEKQTRTAEKVGDLIRIKFPFNRGDLYRMRSLPSRRFDQKGKFWIVPFKKNIVEALRFWGFQLDDELRGTIPIGAISIEPLNPVSVPEIDVKGLKKDLYPFQRKGVGFLEARNGRALIGDEMGLGKTVQALAWLQLHPEKRPAIIVSPASLKFNWRREAEAWLSDPDIQILPTDQDRPFSKDIIITNYDILTDWIGPLLKQNPQVLIVDEIHYIKTPQAKRTKAVKKLGKSIPHIIGLSGTPIINRPIEGHTILKLIAPDKIPNRLDYAIRYCNAQHTVFGWDFNGSSETEELHEKLSSIMIRRLKSEVLTDLPDKMHSFVPMEIDNREEYTGASADLLNWIRTFRGEDAEKTASNAEAIVRIEVLRQIAIRGKMAQAVNWIRDFITSGEKLVIFATHRSVIRDLMNQFSGVAVKLDGGSSQRERQESVDQFQTDPRIRLFIGNIKAAGIGITLTAASNVAFLEFPWSPGELVQAEDRCHRIGQRNAVTIYYLFAMNTIEDKTARLIDKKRKILSKVLDGEEVESSSLLSALIHQIKREEG